MYVPIKVARMVLIEARGGGGGYPLPQALSDSPVNERWKNMSGQVCLLSLGLKGSNYGT